MQVRAILEAASRVTKRGVKPKPEIMIPLTGHVNELKITQTALETVAQDVIKKEGIKVDYKFGTMVEIPRAALTAGRIAEYATFFSFGTNDLTQTVYGYSRDDAEGKFLLRYVEDKVLHPIHSRSSTGMESAGLCVWRLKKAGKPGLAWKLASAASMAATPRQLSFAMKSA